LALKLIEETGGKPAILNYKPRGARRPYPATICVSVNDAIVHGIPNEEPFLLKEGDIVGLDTSMEYNGMITDMAVTVPVGKIDEEARKLIEITKNALYIGIKSARGGKRVGDIGFAIQNFIEPFGYGIVRELAGHGVGYKVHEEPYVPNFGEKGKGEKLKPGMVIAIEPMINEGAEEVFLDKDGYTYRTADGKRSAHFEHTVVITDHEAEILTKL
jgi:methionyl aminopeptidase